MGGVFALIWVLLWQFLRKRAFGHCVMFSPTVNASTVERPKMGSPKIFVVELIMLLLNSLNILQPMVVVLKHLFNASFFPLSGLFYFFLWFFSDFC